MTTIDKYIVNTTDTWPTRSAIVSYDNMVVNASSGSINFENGPILKQKYSGKWWKILSDYAPGRNEKLNLLWSYSMNNGVTAKDNIYAHTLGGTVNGYITPGSGIDSRFGGKSLYGDRVPSTGNTLYDPTNPEDQARLLGDHADELNFAENQRGISSWTRFSSKYTAIHQDDPMGAAVYSAIGSQFSPTMANGFTEHGEGSYIDFLKSRYATDSAYLADRTNPLNKAEEYKAHMARKTRSFFTDMWLPRANNLQLKTSANIYWTWPSESLTTGHLLADLFNLPLLEHTWWRYAYDGNSANYRTQRAAVENVSDPDILLKAFSSLTVQLAYFTGTKRTAAMAIAPLMGWWPQPSSGNGSPPSSAPYIEPYRIRALMRSMICWTLANGHIPVVPSGIYDGIFDEAPSPEYTGYIYPNKPMWYGDPDHYSDIYSFICRYSWLFDAFEAAPSVALVVPCLPTSLSFKNYNGTFNLGDTNYWVSNFIKPLVENNISFTINPVGGAIRQIPLSNYPLSQYDAVVKMNSDSNFTLYGAEIPVSPNVLSYSDFFSGSIGQYPYMVIYGHTDNTRPTISTVRVCSKDKSIAIHLVNTNSCDYSADSGNGLKNNPQNNLVMYFKTSKLVKQPRQILFFEPGCIDAVTCKFVMDQDYLAINIPPLMDYGIILIE